MPAGERINAIWNVIGSTPADGGRRRRRLAAAVALTMLMSGLLTAIGLAVVVLVLAALTVALFGLAAVAHALPNYWPRLRLRARSIAAATARSSRRAATGTRAGLERVGRVVASLVPWLRVRGARLAHRGTEQVSRARRSGATSSAATVTRAREAVESLRHRRWLDPSSPTDLYDEAVRLNAAGTHQRRNGDHLEAVGLHQRALEILLKLDNPRAVALTQNNLALALSHLGDDGNAIALFEEAAATLRALGEEEHEGRIIANLGLAHRRHGRYEQSGNVLQLALTKLPPASTAYETVLAELQRAS